jgi:hypothetical protein
MIYTLSKSKFKLIFKFVLPFITLFSHTHAQIYYLLIKLNSMMATALHNSSAVDDDDPLLPYLWFYSSLSLFSTHTFLTISHSHQFSHFRSIRKALDNSTPNLTELLLDCINKFNDIPRYRNDFRFLKIWFLYVTSFLPQSSLSFSNNFIFISIYLLF